MTESTMRIPTGITLGNLISAAVTIIAVAAGVYAQWVLVSYRMDETTSRLVHLEAREQTMEKTVSDIRLTYATASSLHDLSADQRAALAPLQAKIDQLIDRIAQVDRSQAETAVGLKAVIDSVDDLKRSIMRRSPTIFGDAAPPSRPP